ncbi:MAG: hypothetical protein LBL44_07570 [Treponema sp.]|jgi:tetratricopeptide (TPR) repeat protein|nr:hypothetical protein [Treponema sp.]
MNVRSFAPLVLLLSFRVFAQVPPAPVTGEVIVRTAHYEVTSGMGDGERLAQEMENRFTVYSRLFRFEPARAALPLKVRAWQDRETYDNYVSERLGSSRDGAVYFHYSQSGRRELVINRGSAEERHNLPYQAFIQYLRAFVPSPPSWIREGFAIYFSTMGFSGSGEIIYEENLSWLKTVRDLGAKAPGIEDILLADERGIPDNFQSVSWSLVSFFLTSGREEYFRTLTDCFMVLSGEKTAAENSRAVADRIRMWNTLENLEKDYRAYINSRRTFAELVAEGEKAYAEGDSAGAELAFVTAMNQKPSLHVPYYYMGLLSYGENSYVIAEEYYRMSLERGADFALVSYARGVNAAAAGKNREALAFLEEAAKASPQRYREKAESLMARLEGNSP